MSTIDSDFLAKKAKNIESLHEDSLLKEMSLDWIKQSGNHGYAYNFCWLGRPIIQLPQDIVALQEIIWQVKPDLIIESGIAHGGSLIFSASMLAMLDYCDAVKSECTFNPGNCHRKVLGIDIDIREHNRREIESHPLFHKIEMIQGSSIDKNVIDYVKELAKKFSRIMVFLDSNHTHEHVLAELEAYAPLTTKGSYCVVFDTIIEDLPGDYYSNRDWGKGNNPKTAVREYLKTTDRFIVDSEITSKILITVAPEGYLKCIRE